MTRSSARSSVISTFRATAIVMLIVRDEQRHSHRAAARRSARGRPAVHPRARRGARLRRGGYRPLGRGLRQGLRGRLRTCPCWRPSTPQYRCRACPASVRAEPVPHGRTQVAPHQRRGSLSSTPTGSPGSTSRRRPTRRRSCSPRASAGTRSTSRTCSRAASGRRSTSTPRTRPAATSSPSSTSPSTTPSVGRLNAGELDVFVGPDYLVTLPTVELRPVSRLFQRCTRQRGAAAQPLLARLGPPALRDARRPLRLLLPDPRQDRLQARPDRRGDRRARARARRSACATSTR